MEPTTPQRPRIFRPSGGYEKLVSYKVAKLLYAVTVRFADRYIPRGSRTHDQMEQAARSGERNIGEGSKLSATTQKLEMNSANVGHTLCKITIHLLDNQVDSQARKFEEEGGFSERLYKMRSEAKAKKQRD